MANLFAFLRTLLLSGVGGVAFALTGFPAPWLSGSMVAVAAAALTGFRVCVPNGVRSAVFILLGYSMGAAVSPETLADVARWPGSVAMLMVSVAVTTLVAAHYLHRWCGWDEATARFSAIPGALSYVLALSLRSQADVSRVALGQSVRLFTLVAVMPLALTWIGEAIGGSMHPPTGVDAAIPAPAWEIVLALAASAAVAWLCHRLRVPAAYLMGTMLASGVLHGTGITTARLPDDVMLPAFALMGAVIGTRFAGTTFAMLGRVLPHALESVLLALLVSAAFAAVAARLLGLPFGQLWLAFAPGGVEAMTVMAFVLDLDPAFVGSHHFLRFFALSVVVPIWVRRFMV